MTSKLDPQELERLSERWGRVSRYISAAQGGVDAELANDTRKLIETLRTGQLVPAMPSGDVVEAVSGVAKMREALTWYAEKVHLCRKMTSEGQDARSLLDTDGGAFARAALGEKP